YSSARPIQKKDFFIVKDSAENIHPSITKH
ncbi:MAG: hypothetical protein ACJAUZ_002102, partial [Flavobacteriaceae bacterium]